MIESNMQALAVIRKQVEDGTVDIPRELLQTVAEKLMAAEADSLCSAGYRERSNERTNSRNGYRHRQWDTRVGSIDLAIPKLRQGTYYPGWLLEPRRRSEKALATIVVEAYVQGVSTRRIDKLVEAMGIDGISKSQVSALAQELDAVVKAFRERPLDQGPYTYVWLDATYVKCRENGRVVNVAVVVATAVNAEGHREILGIDIMTVEDGAGWTAFLRDLVARGLTGVKLVVSDAHVGLQNAIAAVLPGAAWQRCRTHFMRNILSHVPKSQQDMVATLVRTVFAQPDRKAVEAQFSVVLGQLEAAGFDKVAEILLEAEGDIVAFKDFPKEHWKQIWSNNPQERLNKEIKRRTNVVGIFPNRNAAIRLIGAVLAEQNDEWAEARRYMNPRSLKKAALALIDGDGSDKTDEKETNNDPQRAAG